MEETDGVGVVDVVVVDGVAAFAVVAVVAAVAAVDDEEEGMDSGFGGGLRLAISRFACGKTTYNDVTEKLCGHSTVFVFLKYIYIKTTAPTLSFEQIQRKKKKEHGSAAHYDFTCRCGPLQCVRACECGWSFACIFSDIPLLLRQLSLLFSLPVLLLSAGHPL